MYRKYTALENQVGTNQNEDRSELAPTTITTLYGESCIEDDMNLVLGNTDNNNQQQDDLEEQEEEEQKQQKKEEVARASLTEEVKQCPMCNWEFPPGMTLDGKNEHIEHHFQ